MPKYKAHLFGGFITFIIIASALSFLKISPLFNQSNQKPNVTLFLLYFSACLIGSLFPDIDTKSKIQKWTYLPLFVIIIITILKKNWLLTSFLSVIGFIPILANHRRLTHRVWFIIFIPLSIPIVMFHFNETVLIDSIFTYIFFVSGALSHLLLDFGPRLR